MVKTIDGKLSGHMSQKELIKRIKKEMPGNPPDVTTSRFYRSFCQDYAEAITPKLEAVDRHIAGSMARGYVRVLPRC